MQGRGRRRAGFVLALGLAPVAALGWMGCGDDDAPTTAGLGKPDPGGTWGAQVAVTVVGRGRVTTPGGRIDCPRPFATSSSQGCFTTVVFPNNAADGATGGMTLTAEPTAGAKFLGWSFQPSTLGGSGRGPDRCNPVLRAGTVPAVDPVALSITLPYGETDGTSPVGREAECASFKRVPLAYNAVATFEGDLPEAGVDANDGGGLDPVAFDITSEGTEPVLLGRNSLGDLYWRFTDGANTAIGYALDTSGGSTSFQRVGGSNASVPALARVKVEPSGVVMLSFAGELAVIRSSAPTTFTPVGSTNVVGDCLALAMDSSFDVHCRLASAIATWKFVGGTYEAPVVTFTNLPSGSDLAVDQSYLYYTTTPQILRLPLNGTDASAPDTIVTNGASGVTNLVAGTSRLAYMTPSGVAVTSSKLPSTTATPTGIVTASAGNVFAVSFDPSSGSTVYGAGTKGIYRWQAGGAAATEFRLGGSRTFTGVAVGTQYVYYTFLGDNRIYRASKSGI